MQRFIHVAMVAVTCCGQAWLGTVAPAQAAPVIDRFEIKGTVKEWCQGNPKFLKVTLFNSPTAPLLPSRAMSMGMAISPIMSATFGLNGE